MIDTIAYVKTDNDKFTGWLVNMPFVVGQADSLEDLKNKVVDLFTVVMKHWEREMKQGNPFELMEVESVQNPIRKSNPTNQ